MPGRATGRTLISGETATGVGRVILLGLVVSGDGITVKNLWVPSKINTTRSANS